MTCLEMLRPAEFLSLALHFFDLPALGQSLRARIGNRDRREQHTAGSDQHPAIDVHAPQLMNSSARDAMEIDSARQGH